MTAMILAKNSEVNSGRILKNCSRYNETNKNKLHVELWKLNLWNEYYTVLYLKIGKKRIIRHCAHK